MSVRRMGRKPLKVSEPDIRPEYDFSGAVRGKYYRRYLESSNVVVIDADVHERFSNAEAVSDALRTLIRAAGKKRGLTKRPTRRAKAARAGGR